jgi:predicted nucleic acid-binding protein
MKRLLLDTNVLSEAGKPAPKPQVIAFLQKPAEIFTSVIALHEIEYGIALLPKGKRRTELETAMAAVVSVLGTNILPVRDDEAHLAAHFRAEARACGRVLHLPDALIAATAKENGLTLATRNIADFDYLGVAVIDPWALPL